MSKTREQRRRSKRILYRSVVALLFLLVLALLLALVKYGLYVQEKVRNSAPTWATAEVIDPSDVLPVEVLNAASDRYEYERDPILYMAMIKLQGEQNAKKEPASSANY